MGGVGYYRLFVFPKSHVEILTHNVTVVREEGPPGAFGRRHEGKALMNRISDMKDTPESSPPISFLEREATR